MNPIFKYLNQRLQEEHKKIFKDKGIKKLINSKKRNDLPSKL